MNVQTIREFRLSPPGSDNGISCDADGAFVGPVALLKRARVKGAETWAPRDGKELSEAIGAQFGLPIDVASKSAGLAAIAKALNADDIAHAQLVTLHLNFPEPPPLAKTASSRSDRIRFIRELYWSDWIKWDEDEHPRWPAGSEDSKGGKFAPKGTEAGAPSSSSGNASQADLDGDLDIRSRKPALNDGVYHPDGDVGGSDRASRTKIAATWPSNGPPDEAAVCARFARLCVLLAPLLLGGDTPQHTPLHDHHIFPKQFRQYFEQRGINIDQYTVTMDASTHLEGVHGAGMGEMPGQWNKAWADFIAKNSAATRQQVFDFAGQLMKRYGISSSEIHPYGQLP